MAGKKSRLIWIILGAIVVVIAALSFYNCANKGVSVDVSDFKEIIVAMDGKNNSLTKDEFTAITDNKIVETVASSNRNYTAVSIEGLEFDSYNLSFRLVLINGDKKTAIVFESTYGRTNMAEYEAYADNAGISYSYTDPNAGSIWSSLLPIFGSLIIAVVFFILPPFSKNFRESTRIYTS